MRYLKTFNDARIASLAILISCLCSSFSFGQTNGTQEDIATYEKRQQEAVKRFLKMGYKQFIETKDGDYSELVGENALGKPLYFMTSNNNVGSALHAEVLHNGFDSFTLNGAGYRIGLWENGIPRRAHEMFRTSLPPNLQSRIELAPNQNPTIQRHASHIAGTIIGNQFNASTSSPPNAIVRGVAFGSTIKAWDWLNVASEMQSAATTDNIITANASFGINPLYMHPAEFGRYNDIAMQWDAVMCNNNEFQIVKSVGNARDDKKANGYPEYPQVAVLDGYDLLEGAGVAKNVLVVGSVNLTGAIMENGSYSTGLGGIGEPYSSWGPTDDGRIKPDLVTQGKNVFSSLETQNNAYGTYTGTSQAAAGVTAGITLLEQYWDNKFAEPMWSSTVRALLIHTVDEIDSRGPDYRNGWGVVNLEKAAQTLQQRGNQVIIRQGYYYGQEMHLNLAASGTEDLIVTLAWTDPAGVVTPIDVNNPNPSINEVTAKLVNDLDIALIKMDNAGNPDLTLIDPSIPAPNNNVLLPWKLKEDIMTSSSANLAQMAERGNNDRDNVEKIEVYQNLIPANGGMFQLVISNKNFITDACTSGQRFSLIISGVSYCDDDVVFLQNQDNELYDFTGTKVLAHTISASNMIQAISPFFLTNNDFVEYQAREFIDLLPQSANGGTGDEGFTAEAGSDFLAHIDCTTDINQRTAFSPHDIQTIIDDDTADQHIKVDPGKMIVFPNPLITDILNVQFSLTQVSNIKINIYDMSGKLMFKDENPKEYPIGMSKKAIDLNALPAGTYILNAHTIDGDHQIKFIKN